MSFFQDAPGNPDLFLADATLRDGPARRLPAELLALARARCAAGGLASPARLPPLAAQAELVGLIQDSVALFRARAALH